MVGATIVTYNKKEHYFNQNKNAIRLEVVVVITIAILLIIILPLSLINHIVVSLLTSIDTTSEHILEVI